MADKNKRGIFLSFVNSMPCVLWLFKTEPYWIFSCMSKIISHLDIPMRMWGTKTFHLNYHINNIMSHVVRSKLYLSKDVSTIFYTVHQPFAKNVALEMSGITKCSYSPWFINGRDWTIDVIICVSFIVKFKSCHWDNRKICCIFPICIKFIYNYSLWNLEKNLITL